MMDYIDGEPVNLSVPVQKIDVERRLVSGFATLDNIDQQNDIVLSSAAKKAFEDFLGNLRLMHQPIPVGKVVDFKEDTYVNPKDGKSYNGVYVTAYISKGAESAWQMVLDGTLTGFSIGGTATDKETVIQDGSPVRIIKAMKLVELSLVDSPANQHAKILEIHKMADGTTEASGFSSDLKLEDVFYCKSDEILMPGTESRDCLKCGEKMENIGWIENLSIKDDKEQMQKMLSSFLSKASESEGPENVEKTLQTNKGGKTMENETVVSEEVVDVEKADAAPEEDVVEKAVDAADTNEVVVEATAEVLEKAAAEDAEEEVVDSTDDLVEKSEGAGVPSTLIDEVKTALSEALASFASTQNEAVEKAFAEALEATDTKIEALKSELLESVTKSFDEVGVRVSDLEGNTAIKKSGELGGSKADKIEKNESVWNGAFSPGRFFDSNSILD